jgi:hypothetical protein
MTRDAYFEMCEALGTEPIEEEIPVEFEDFLLDVQEALGIYQKLRDEWDYMGGNYIGKNYTGLLDILELLDVPVEDRRTQYELVGIIDRHRSQAIANAKPKTK